MTRKEELLRPSFKKLLFSSGSRAMTTHGKRVMKASGLEASGKSMEMLAAATTTTKEAGV